MSVLTAPLAVFSGPYAILARVGVVVALALACATFGAVQMHRHDAKRYDSLRAEYTTFKDGVVSLGAQAKRQAERDAAADRQNKEKADAENARSTAALRADLERLRRARPGSSFVPAAAPDARRPELACYDRPELERAFREFVAEARGLVDEGSQGAVDLNTARAWAASSRKP